MRVRVCVCVRMCFDSCLRRLLSELIDALCKLLQAMLGDAGVFLIFLTPLFATRWVRSSILLKLAAEGFARFANS